MLEKLQHLRALQAFNEAAQHSSLSKAAASLNVTHGAISRQIKLLEEYLGVKLLHRRASGVELTAKGEQLLQSTHPAFTTLRKGVSQIRRQRMRQSLKVSLPNAVAVKWFVPHLPSFHRQNPSIQLFLETSDALTDFDISEVDVALRFGKSGWEGLHAEKIADEALIVVASPSLVEDIRLPMAPEEIAGLPLLCDEFNQGWDKWAKQVGFPLVKTAQKNRIRFYDSAVLLEAAIDRQGVALARQLLASRDIESGRLIRLDNTSVPLDRSLYFVCRKGDQDRIAVRTFRKWLSSI